MSSSGAYDSDDQEERREERFARQERRGRLKVAAVPVQAAARRYIAMQRTARMRRNREASRLEELGPRDVEDWAKERKSELLQREKQKAATAAGEVRDDDEEVDSFDLVR